MNDQTLCVLSHGLSQAVYLLTTTHLLNKIVIHNSTSSCVAISREAPHCVSCWEMLTLQQHSLELLSIWPLCYSASKHCVCVCMCVMLPAADKPLRCESEFCRGKTERERGDTSLCTFCRPSIDCCILSDSNTPQVRVCVALLLLASHIWTYSRWSQWFSVISFHDKMFHHNEWLEEMSFGATGDLRICVTHYHSIIAVFIVSYY